MRVGYLTSGTILIGRFSDKLKVGRFWNRGRRRQAFVSSRIGLWPHRSWPLFARRSDINRAPALQARIEMKLFERRYSTLWSSVSDILCFVTPSPCVYWHLWQYNPLCLRWESVGQEKLACALRVEINHLERNYSTLCCYNFRYLFLCHPTPCVYWHLWQYNPLCLRWGLLVKRSLHVQ